MQNVRILFLKYILIMEYINDLIRRKDRLLPGSYDVA